MALKSYSQNPTFYLCLILITYAVLLLPTVNRQGISWDEQTDIEIARSFSAGGWFTGSNSDPSQTRLPMYAVALLYALTGTDDLLTARLVSVLLGALTIAGVYVFCRREYDARRGLLASAILASSPFFLSFARTAFTETDIYVACALAWLLVGVSRLRARCTVGAAGVAAALLGLALAAKFTVVFLFPALLLYARTWPKREPGLEHLRWRDLLGLGALAAPMCTLAWFGWSNPGFGPSAESDGLVAAGHYVLTAVWWGAALAWLARRHAHTAPPLLLAALVILVALSVFVMVPPVHLTNPDIVNSLLDRFHNEMGRDWGFVVEAASLHLACVIFKSSPLVGLGLLAGPPGALWRYKRGGEASLTLLAVIFYFLGLALLPLAQTFYMMPLLPLLAVLGADQWYILLETRRSTALLAGSLAAALLIVDLFLCYPDYNLNGYQWLGPRYVAGRSTIGYRSVVQTTSDGVQQTVRWVCDNAASGDRVVIYAYPWHIVEAACPGTRLRFSPGKWDSVRTRPDYVIVHINYQIRQSWAAWFTGEENNSPGGSVFWEPFDGEWLRARFVKIAIVRRAFGLEVASVWQRKD